MTEREWLRTKQPSDMLRFLNDNPEWKWTLRKQECFKLAIIETTLDKNKLIKWHPGSLSDYWYHLGIINRPEECCVILRHIVGNPFRLDNYIKCDKENCENGEVYCWDSEDEWKLCSKCKGRGWVPHRGT